MNKFRNQQNVRYLKALFLETNTTDKNVVLYTLKDEDYKEYPSLYRLYMACSDPTEWTFAQTYMDGWEHWKMLCECEWFKPIIKRWREELEISIRSKALQAVRYEAEAGTKNSYSANKTLLEGKWIAQEKTKRGRPTKAEVHKEAIIEAERKKRVNADFERMNLNVVDPT